MALQRCCLLYFRSRTNHPNRRTVHRVLSYRFYNSGTISQILPQERFVERTSNRLSGHPFCMGQVLVSAKFGSLFELLNDELVDNDHCDRWHAEKCALWYYWPRFLGFRTQELQKHSFQKKSNVISSLASLIMWDLQHGRHTSLPTHFTPTFSRDIRPLKLPKREHRPAMNRIHVE